MTEALSDSESIHGRGLADTIWRRSRREPVLVLSGLAVLALMAAVIWPAALMWHRAILIHLLLAGTSWWPRTWAARGVVVLGYVASLLVWPWAQPASAVALSLGLVAGSLLEARARRFSVHRLSAWRGAVTAAALACAVPPLLSAAGAGASWALPVLVGYDATLALVIVLVLVATRAGTRAWGADIAVHLVSPPSDLLEEALASTRTDPPEIRTEVIGALAAATRLRERLAAREAELSQAARDLEDSRLRLAAADEEERRALRDELDRIAVRKLDGVAAALAAFPPPDHERGARSEEGEALGRARVHLQAVLQHLQDLGRGLAPPALGSGLSAALAGLAATSPTGVTLDLPDSSLIDELPSDVSSCVYFVATEALTNVVRHAHARHVTVRLHIGPGVELLVEDDGDGLGETPSGLGLTSMRERAAEVGGGVEVTDVSTCGTLVRLSIPVLLAGAR